jgi:uncharacterized protein (TIGR00369 family)
VLADHLRNPWGILHGGAVAVLADVASCRAVTSGRNSTVESSVAALSVAAADTDLHYLRPAKVGPIEARCEALPGQHGRSLVRVQLHDVGADDRLIALGTVVVVDC